MPTPESQSSIIIVAVKRVLRPLVGVLLDNGLNYAWLSKVLKEIFVDVARKEADGELSDSRISLITGVHRKDIKRFRELGIQRDDSEVSKLLPARIISTWLADGRFSNNGEPKALLAVAEGEHSGFDQLVISCTKDIRPRAVLDEWLANGTVSVKGDLICLEESAYLPDQSSEQKIVYLGRNVADHLSSARHNVSNGEPLMLERSVYYDALSQESVAQLEEQARELGMQMLKELNAQAYKLQQKDSQNKENKGGQENQQNDKRINFGVYFHRANQTD